MFLCTLSLFFTHDYFKKNNGLFLRAILGLQKKWADIIESSHILSSCPVSPIINILDWCGTLVSIDEAIIVLYSTVYIRVPSVIPDYF